MKVIIFNTPLSFYGVKNNEDYLPPLGQGYIATILKENDIEVKLIDCVYEGLGFDEILKIIRKEKPNYVGLNIFTVNKHIVKQIVEKCDCKVSFLIGGQAVKYMYEEILDFRTLNDIHIIIGEGEYITSAIVKNDVQENIFLIKGNKKVYWIDRKSIYFPKDISAIKLDRTFFKGRNVLNVYKEVESQIVASRGCIYNCAFCGGAAGLNKDVIPRERTEESIIKEIENIVELDCEVKSIRILDDLFLKSKSKIIKAIDIFNLFPELSWRAMAHVRSFRNASDILGKLKGSGCKELFIGIESGSANIRERIHKIGDIIEVKDVIYKLLEVGINIKGYFIYGFPEESIEDFQMTYELARYLKEISEGLPGDFRTSVFQFRPYHGTELYDYLLRKNTIISDCTLNEKLSNICGRHQFNYQSGNFSSCTEEEVNEYIQKTLRLNDGV